MRPEPLPRIDGISPVVDAAIEELIQAIEDALTVSASPPLEVNVGRLGMAFRIVMPQTDSMAALTTAGGITGAPNADTLGEGNIVLRPNNGAALSDGVTAKCYSNFTKAVPHPMRLVVSPYGNDWLLVGANGCPPTGSGSSEG